MKNEIKDLLILSRPEWGFIFSAVAGMLGLFYQLPVLSIFVGWLSIYAFTCGHFCLNGYYDRHSDSINPREFSLRNPFVKNSDLQLKHIIVWICFLWSSLIPINILLIPKSLILSKLVLAFFAFGLAIGGSILYSIPPIRMKARPFFDLFITVIVIGVSVPFYIGLLGNNILIETNLLIIGIGLSILLVAGIHLPTILTDLETDKKIGDITTAVYLGWNRASYLTSIIIVLRVVGFALINLYLMSIGILITSFMPFIFGVIEIIVASNLASKKNRNAADILMKSIISTSSGGAILFGILYSPILISVYM